MSSALRTRVGVNGHEVYSPRIREELIPVLYHTAKARRMPMTSLVDLLLYRALAVEPVPETARNYLSRVCMGSPDAKLSDVAGVESDLELKLRAASADAFESPAEVEAWYRGCEHGLLRGRQLLARRGQQTDAKTGEQLRLLNLLNMFRHDSRRLLAESAA
jgi:hypothetical protein